MEADGGSDGDGETRGICSGNVGRAVVEFEPYSVCKK